MEGLALVIAEPCDDVTDEDPQGRAIGSSIRRGLAAGTSRRKRPAVVSAFDLPTPQKRAIGERLRMAREAAGIKQSEAAEALGYSQQVQLCNLEAGNRLPPLATLVHLAELYGTTADYLLALVDDPDRDPVASLHRHLASQVAGDVRQLVDLLRANSVQVARSLAPDVARVTRLASMVIELQAAVSRLRQLAPEFDELQGGATVVRRAEVATEAARLLLADMLAGRVQLPTATQPGKAAAEAPA